MFRGLFTLILLFTALWSAPDSSASAEDRVLLTKEVGDRDFYRAVACFAKPSRKCRRPFVKWPLRRARDLRVALAHVAPGYPPQEANHISLALDDAISEINAVGAAVKLRRVAPAAKADINVYLLNIPIDTKLKRTRIKGMRGEFVSWAIFKIWWNSKHEINRGVVVFPNIPTNKTHTFKSIMLEEITQSLGFISDIEGYPYEFGSIFSDTRNARITLGAQDKEAIKLHYPPR